MRDSLGAPGTEAALGAPSAAKMERMMSPGVHVAALLPRSSENFVDKCLHLHQVTPFAGPFSWNVGLKRRKNIFGTPSKKLLLTLWCLEPWAGSALETDTQKVTPCRALREHLLGTRGKLLAARVPEDRRVLIMASPLLCCLAIQGLTFACEINLYQRF